MDHIVVWFDIPVSNLERAMKFYSQVLDIAFEPMELGGEKMAIFPYKPGIVSGALVERPSYSASSKGPLVYLNGGKDLSEALARVESAGGKVEREKMSIGENGFIAHFTDSEGNRIALHSMN